MNQWFRRLSLGSRITALTAGAGVLLSMIAISAALTAAGNRNDVSRLTERISPSVAAGERLLAMALAEQTGATQYTASGLDYYRTLYTRSIEQEARVTSETERLLRGEPALRDQLVEIRQQLASWRADVADPMVADVILLNPQMLLWADHETSVTRATRASLSAAPLSPVPGSNFASNSSISSRAILTLRPTVSST